MIFSKYMPDIINVIGCRSSFTHTRDGEQRMKARKHLLCSQKFLKLCRATANPVNHWLRNLTGTLRWQ